MAPGKKVALHWKKPFTYVYGDNYDYGFNSYKDVMEWMDHKKTPGITNAKPPKAPVFEERVAQHIRYKLGRSSTTTNLVDLDMTSDPVLQRLEFIKKKSAEQDARATNRLRRVKSFGAFTTKAVEDIDDDLHLEATSKVDSRLEKRRTRSKHLQFLQDDRIKMYETNRERIDVDDQDIGIDMMDVASKKSNVTYTRFAAANRDYEFDDLHDSEPEEVVKQMRKKYNIQKTDDEER